MRFSLSFSCPGAKKTDDLARSHGWIFCDPGNIGGARGEKRLHVCVRRPYTPPIIPKRGITLAVGARDFHKLESPERKALQDTKVFLGLVRSFRWRTCADLGCGIGFYTLPMAQEWRTSRQIIAVDRSTPMLEELDKRVEYLGLTNVHIRQSVSDRIPIEDTGVQFVNLGNVYHEIKGRLNFLKEVYRILKPGGFFLLIDWDPEEDMDIGPSAKERIPMGQVVQDLEFAGFDSVKNVFVYIGHYALVARKPLDHATAP